MAFKAHKIANNCTTSNLKDALRLAEYNAIREEAAEGLSQLNPPIGKYSNMLLNELFIVREMMSSQQQSRKTIVRCRLWLGNHSLLSSFHRYGN